MKRSIAWSSTASRWATTAKRQTALVWTGQFTVPADVPAGSKEVEFFGIQGSYGNATYTGQGTLVTRRFDQVTTTTTWRWWSPPPPPRRWDPLAQSFTLDESRHLTSVDVFFHAVGSKDFTVQLRESDNGQPSMQTITQVRVKNADIQTTGATRCTFPLPVYLNADQEYFLVFMSDDQTHALRNAELGKYDSTANQWVSSQPYTIGVLLSSSNASSWTVHNDMDLQFQLNVAEFSQSSLTVNLGSLTVSNMTDLMVRANVDVPGDATRVSFRYTRSTGEIFNLHPSRPSPWRRASATPCRCRPFSRATQKSPRPFTPSAEPAQHTRHDWHLPGPAVRGRAGGSTMRVVYEAQLEAGAAVTPQYDNGGFQSLSLASATQVGDGWVEYVYEDTGITGLSATAVKLTPAAQPQVVPSSANFAQ